MIAKKSVSLSFCSYQTIRTERHWTPRPDCLDKGLETACYKWTTPVNVLIINCLLTVEGTQAKKWNGFDQRCLTFQEGSSHSRGEADILGEGAHILRRGAHFLGTEFNSYVWSSHSRRRSLHSSDRSSLSMRKSSHSEMGSTYLMWESIHSSRKAQTSEGGSSHSKRWAPIEKAHIPGPRGAHIPASGTYSPRGEAHIGGRD